MFWGCISTNASQDPAVQKTIHLVLEARNGLVDHRCFWLRGIVPGEWTKPKTPPSHNPVPIGQGETILQQIIKFYLDGSGGAASRDPRIRRCAWAWVVPNYDTDPPEPLYGMRGHLFMKTRKARLCQVLNIKHW